MKEKTSLFSPSQHKAGTSVVLSEHLPKELEGEGEEECAGHRMDTWVRGSSAGDLYAPPPSKVNAFPSLI